MRLIDIPFKSNKWKAQIFRIELSVQGSTLMVVQMPRAGKISLWESEAVNLLEINYALISQ